MYLNVASGSCAVSRKVTSAQRHVRRLQILHRQSYKMCGIFALLNHTIHNDYINKLKILIDARGPDYQSAIRVYETTCGIKLKLSASILHLRGEQLQEQPVVNQDGSILLFNGQVYEYDRQPLDETLSDTLFLNERLSACSSKAAIATTLSKIDGPFAVIYWSSSLNCLFYGRDFFGRKSLCTLGSNGIPSIVSSVSLAIDKNTDKWQEVDSRGIHCLDFSQHDKIKQTIFMWNIDDIYPKTDKCEMIKLADGIEIDRSLIAPISILNQDLRLHHEFSHTERNNAVERLETLLLDAVKKRWKYNRVCCLKCRIGLTSQQVECRHSKIAVAFSGGIDSTILAIALHKVFNDSETIDLITVAFKDKAPDRISVAEAFRELRQLCPTRNWRLVICDISLAELQSERSKTIRHLIQPCNTVVDDGIGCACWFIARAQGRSLDSLIDDELFELHHQKFLEYNPDYSNDHASDRISAAYESPASMLYAGMGIDEQLGGYSSHRAAWQKFGNRGLLDEIAFQMRRIPTRNLGRDDRTFSHHGRDVKLPFLDYDLVSFLNDLPVSLKMSLNESPEIGPKKLLRELAQRWSLKDTSGRVKRALQFGTRIACLEDASEKGGDICSRLDSIHPCTKSTSFNR